VIPEVIPWICYDHSFHIRVSASFTITQPCVFGWYITWVLAALCEVVRSQENRPCELLRMWFIHFSLVRGSFVFISLNVDQLSYTNSISKVHSIFHALLLRCTSLCCIYKQCRYETHCSQTSHIWNTLLHKSQINDSRNTIATTGIQVSNNYMFRPFQWPSSGCIVLASRVYVQYAKIRLCLMMRSQSS
jgi:hypothetical protein